jgi:murein DD-endopeptidase MepM/ murein hydrolase activator NlpD
VQPGDTLFIIAAQFGVSVEELIDTNQITNPNQLNVGDQLVIPGLPGVRGVLTTELVAYGESPSSISRRHRIPVDTLARLNRMVSPVELYAGSSVILPKLETGEGEAGRVYVTPGISALELAVMEATNPWNIVLRNQFDSFHDLIPGDVLLVDGADNLGPGGLPPQITDVEIGTFPLIQGESTLIELRTSGELAVQGHLEMVDLRTGAEIPTDIQFFHTDEVTRTALQGVHAMAETGLYPLLISGEFSDGQSFIFMQLVPIMDGGYGYDPPLQVDPKTLDAKVTRPEDILWTSLAAEASPERYWEGPFASPSPFGDCWTSQYGSRRSYNGSAYNYFHTGLDFCGGIGIEIRAPAPGKVVFSGPLVVRGNATMIDHGWGVYTGYMHQSELLVEVGDWVETGQLIGLVGGTGRVTGAHLHWEVWVGGVQVNPVEWLEQTFP